MTEPVVDDTEDDSEIQALLVLLHGLHAALRALPAGRALRITSEGIVFVEP